MAWAAGCAWNSSFSWHMAQRTTALPVSFAIVTRTASSPHRGHMKTVGSLFFTIRITLRLLLPKRNEPDLNGTDSLDIYLWFEDRQHFFGLLVLTWDSSAI